MNVTKAVKIWIDYHRAHSKKNTVRACQFIANQRCLHFKAFEVDQISTDRTLYFLNELTEGDKPYTKRGSLCPSVANGLHRIRYDPA